MTNAQTIPAYLDNTRPIEERIEDALNRMTVEEKVAMTSGKSRALLPLSPLRTVRESFPSYGSSNSIFLFVVRNRLILSTVSFISLVAVVMDKLPYN